MASNSETENSEMVTTIKDDDDDLEALRLAALLSRKSTQELTNGQKCNIPSSGANSVPHNKKSFAGTFHQDKHWNNFVPTNKWSRQRSSNLIVINPVPLEETKPVSHKLEPPPKLVLPQDKWCNNNNTAPAKMNSDSSGPGKFSRIRYQSDDSDLEDSDSELEKSEEKSSARDSEDLASDNATSSDQDDNESLSDVLVTQEPDTLNNIDTQLSVETEKCTRETNSIPAVADSTDSVSGTSSDLDENVENVAKDCVSTKDNRTNVQSRVEKSSNSNRQSNEDDRHSSRKRSPSKQPLDLREVLKAKRDVRNSSEYDSNSEDERPSSPVATSMKSVLSVVKRSPHHSDDLSKKLYTRHQEPRVKTKSKERPTSRSVFLTLDQTNKSYDNNSDGMQVTVVTGSQDEKKCSVHMRLGRKNNSHLSSKAKVPVTSRLGLASTSLQQTKDKEGEQRSVLVDNFTKDKSQRRRSRSRSGNKRSRSSGFRGSKESERDAKICRVEKVNTVRR